VMCKCSPFWAPKQAAASHRQCVVGHANLAITCISAGAPGMKADYLQAH
jgi:hypothetical protein